MKGEQIANYNGFNIFVNSFTCTPNNEDIYILSNQSHIYKFNLENNIIKRKIELNSIIKGKKIHLFKNILLVKENNHPILYILS